MTDLLDDDEILRLRSTFKRLDTNNDGFITLNELSNAINKESKTHTQPEIKRLLSKADCDGDGKLSYEELVLTSVHRKLMVKEERLYQAFCRIDKDRNGVINKEELEEVLGKDKEFAQEILKKSRLRWRWAN